MRRFAGVLLLVCVAASIPAACREPTEMTIDVRLFTDLDCSSVQSVAIVARENPAAAEAALVAKAYASVVSKPTCDGSSIGTLVVTPDQDDGAVVVAARVFGAGNCEAPEYKGCIIARRQFSFVKHKPLFLPISLELRCLDIPCGAETSCRATACVSSNVECNDEGTCRSDAEPQAAPGGGSVLPDGGVIDTPPPNPDGGPVTDAGSDASSDAGVDARADGGLPNEGGTNKCQLTIPADCRADGGDLGCCENLAVDTCRMQVNCIDDGSYFFRCLGRAGCTGGDYCCTSSNLSGKVASVTRCADCMQDGDIIVCSDVTDCPLGWQCTGMYTPNDGTGHPGRSRSRCVP